MLRYVITFPGKLSMEEFVQIREQLHSAVTDWRWRDLVLVNGGTIVDLRRGRMPSVAVRNAQRTHVR
jgi:hypothetical protein